ncbi:DUF4013 domain-containing protein [Haloarchaeobius sp. TZWWS8]|uniref:DUF4013 domain-containing protein n=1 Tax=Haloarchaeobius sp. TZWWS8 TaxID=3446121 RepID=UPI003EB9F051
MIEDAVSYPFEGDEGLKRLAIGGLLILLSIFIVPIFLVIGYLVAVLRETLQGSTEPPAYDDWGALFVDGLTAFVIGLVYGLVPLAIFGVVAFGFLGAGAAAGGNGGGIIAGFGLLSLLLLIPVYVVVYYITPAALANFAREGRLGAAFDFTTLGNVVTSGDYVVAALVAIGISLVANVATTLLAATVVGLVVVPFVSFYVQVATFRLFGSAFAKATDTERTAEQHATAGY